MSWSGFNHKPPSIPFTDSLECRTWTAVQLQKTQSGPKPHSWQVQASTKWFRFKVLRSADICRGSKWCLIQPAKTDSHLITLLPLRIFFSFQTWLNPVEDATWQTCHRFINPPIHHPMRSHIGKVPWGWSSSVFFCVQSGTNLFRFIIILTFSLHTTLSSVLCTMDEHEWLCVAVAWTAEQNTEQSWKLMKTGCFVEKHLSTWIFTVSLYNFAPQKFSQTAPTIAFKHTQWSRHWPWISFQV